MTITKHMRTPRTTTQCNTLT